jgi:DNA-binding CsgD family transcriptional regulator
MGTWDAMVESSLRDAVLRLLAEAWQTQRPAAEWLRGVVEAVEPLLAPELGAVGAIVEAGQDQTKQLSVVPYARNLPHDLFPLIERLVTFSRSGNDMRRNFASRAPVMTFSEFTCYNTLKQMLAPAGIGDVAVIFVGPVVGTSLALASVHRERRYFLQPERRVLAAAAEQLRTAFACHRLASNGSASASELVNVLSPERISIESRCCELLLLGLDTKDIAEALQTSPETVRKHLSNSMKKQGVRTRDALTSKLRSAQKLPESVK